jgi:uncharacterized protein YydD (DUF2326 family)
MRAAYLLGLDVGLVVEKFDLREEIKKISEMSSRFAKDPILKDYFVGKKDLNLEIRDLKEQLKTLESALEKFQVAENYHEVEKRAAELKAALQKDRNFAVVLANKIRQVEQSLSSNPDVSLAMVRQMYSDAKIHFSNELNAKLEEVERFHLDLLHARQVRLKTEKQTLDKRLTRCNSELQKLNDELNSNLRFLNEHGALGELISLSDRANDVRGQLQKLEDYKELKKKYRDRGRELQVALTESDSRAEKYLDENQALIETIADPFREITKALYPDKKSGLTIENDEGDNQTRFKIDAKIISDASQGINEAKIFAYDTTLVLLKRNHEVDFVCHDSRLFSDIDPRQRSKIFQIAFAYSNDRDFQYIATVNQDQIEALRLLMSAEEFDSIFAKSTVLELNDDSAADKLLGIDIDLDY